MSDDPRRVLVVEDEVFIRVVLSAALEDEGFEVRTAANGREALAVLNQWLPDLIILDLRMPWMDGPTFRARQRSNSAIADIPVIVLSADRDMQSKAESIEAAAVLSKPFDLDALLKTVERHIKAAPFTPAV